MKLYPACKAVPPQQMSVDTYLWWSRLYSEAASVPPTSQDTLIQGLYEWGQSFFTKTDGNSIACQGHVVLWSSVLTKHRQMRWYILIGGHKEHQRSARDATHHLYRKPNMRPPTVTTILHGSRWDRALRLPCKVVVMKTNGKPQYVMVGTKQQTDYKRQKSV